VTNEQISEVLAKYEEYLSPYGVPLRHTSDGVVPDETQAARHILWMCGEVRKFLQDGRHEKAHRWLGFIQGVLWKLGHYTISDMRGHNTSRPEEG
jgi:hypothetical protein